MATIIQHGTAPYWGVKATLTGVYLENLEYGNTATTAQLKDQNGKVVGVTVYDQEITFSGSGAVLMGSAETQDSRSFPSTLTQALGTAISALADPPDGLINCILGYNGNTTAVLTSLNWTEGNESIVNTNVSGNIYAW